jgi:hypothetical protein
MTAATGEELAAAASERGTIPEDLLADPQARPIRPHSMMRNRSPKRVRPSRMR